MTRTSELTVDAIEMIRIQEMLRGCCHSVDTVGLLHGGREVFAALSTTSDGQEGFDVWSLSLHALEIGQGSFNIVDFGLSIGFLVT